VAGELTLELKSMYRLAGLHFENGQKRRGEFCIEQASEFGNNEAIKELEKLNTFNNKRPAEPKALNEKPKQKKRKLEK
jgi:hypothetical protein